MASCDFVMPFGTYTGYALALLPDWYVEHLQANLTSMASRFPDAVTALRTFLASSSPALPSPSKPALPSPSGPHPRSLVSRLNAVRHDPDKIDEIHAGIAHLDGNLHRIHNDVHDTAASLHRHIDAQHAHTAHMMGHVYRQLAVDGPIKASFGDVHQHIREAHFGAAQQVHGVSSKVDEISTDVKHLSTTLGAVEEKMISAVKEKLDAAMKEKLDAATEQQKKHAAEQLKALVEAVEGKLNGVDVASMSKLALPSPIDIQKAAGDMDEGLIDPAKLPGFATRSPPSSPWKRNNPPEPDMELLELPAHSPLPVFPPAALSEANNKLQRSNAQIAILVAQLHRMGYQLRTSTTRNSQFVEIAAQWTEGKLSDKDLFTKLNRLLEGQDVAVDPDMD